MCGFCNALWVAADVVTVAVPLPVVLKEPDVTMHLGVSAAEFDGLPEFNVQVLRVTFAE